MTRETGAAGEPDRGEHRPGTTPRRVSEDEPGARERRAGDDPEPMPSRRLAVVVALLGTVLSVYALIRVVSHVPAAGAARPMTGLLLALGLALGGFSLVRLLQFLRLATTWPTRAAGTAAPVPRRLADAHSLHAIWLMGLGASIAFMGALGVWSALDGNPSGLEPGWHLIVIGTLCAGPTWLVSRRLGRQWEQLSRHSEQVGRRHREA